MVDIIGSAVATELRHNGPITLNVGVIVGGNPLITTLDAVEIHPDPF